MDGIFIIQPLTCIICVIIMRGAHYRFLFSENPRAGLTTKMAEPMLCKTKQVKN